MVEKLTSILNLVIKDEESTSIINELETYILRASNGHKATIQKFQQVYDNIEILKSQIFGKKRNYQEMTYLRIIEEINDLIDDIRTLILNLKIL